MNNKDDKMRMSVKSQGKEEWRGVCGQGRRQDSAGSGCVKPTEGGD